MQPNLSPINSARLELTGLNKRWWDKAMQKIDSARPSQLRDWEHKFVAQMKEVAHYGNPTVKQFNLLRDIAGRL